MNRPASDDGEAPLLEPTAQAFARATSDPPFIYQLGPAEGRRAVEAAQSGPVDLPDIDEEWIDIHGGPTGRARGRIVKPKGSEQLLPAILYLHGTGWVFGNADTHDRLTRELAVGANAAVVFAEYDRAPEQRYPIAIEQSYAIARWIASEGAGRGLDAGRLAVAGDCVGGNMAAALTLMAKACGDVTFAQQVLFYPATDAGFDSPSYRQFAEGYWLRREAMEWYWEQYLRSDADRAEITASPLRATVEQLRGLPPALIITAEADILRDQGESYAAHLRAAGVPVVAVRYGGIIHDFVMLNALRGTQAAEAAISQAAATLRAALRA